MVRALNLELSLTRVPRLVKFPLLSAICQAAQYLVIFICNYLDWFIRLFLWQKRSPTPLNPSRYLHSGWSCSFRLFLRSVHQIYSKLHTLVYHKVNELVMTFDFCPMLREPFLYSFQPKLHRLDLVVAFTVIGWTTCHMPTNWNAGENSITRGMRYVLLISQSPYILLLHSIPLTCARYWSTSPMIFDTPQWPLLLT